MKRGLFKEITRKIKCFIAACLLYVFAHINEFACKASNKILLNLVKGAKHNEEKEENIKQRSSSERN